MDVNYTIPLSVPGELTYMWLQFVDLIFLKTILDVSHALFNIQERISSCLFGPSYCLHFGIMGRIRVFTGPAPLRCELWIQHSIREEFIQDLEMFASTLISQHIYKYLSTYCSQNMYVYLYVPSSPSSHKIHQKNHGTVTSTSKHLLMV